LLVNTRAREIFLTQLVDADILDRPEYGADLFDDVLLIQALKANVVLNYRNTREEFPSRTLPPIAVDSLEFGDADKAARIVDEHGPFDVVIASDVTYEAPIVPMFVATLRDVTSAHHPTYIILAHDRRGPEDELLRLLRAQAFTASVLHTSEETLIIEATAVG
jgi:hypothetical protein